MLGQVSMWETKCKNKCVRYGPFDLNSLTDDLEPSVICHNLFGILSPGTVSEIPFRIPFAGKDLYIRR